MSRELARSSSFCFGGGLVPQEQSLPYGAALPTSEGRRPGGVAGGAGRFPGASVGSVFNQSCSWPRGLGTEAKLGWKGCGLSRWTVAGPRSTRAGPVLSHRSDQSGGHEMAVTGRARAPGRVFSFPSLPHVGSKDLKLWKFFIKNGFPVFLKNGAFWWCRGRSGRAGWR